MTSTIDELSRRKDADGYAEKRMAAEKARNAFVPSSSNPLLSIAKHYALDYGAVLLYADHKRVKSYENPIHEGNALADILDSKPPLTRQEFKEFQAHIEATIEKRDVKQTG